ncbi:MAG: hypothetical protein IAG13_24125, partial [Deltaproteobacteria bacterium]|nr:hypothetical protein [Nannocystaceae bacterium]
MQRSTRLTPWLLPLVLASCNAPATTEAGDGERDEFSPGGKGDIVGPTDEEACAVLTLVNTASFEQLDLEVGLRSDAAVEIVAHRRGPDDDDGTSDDDPFDDLAELDEVPYVGRHALAAMLDHVDAADIECGNVELQLLAFNDLHGNLEPPGGSSGRIQTGADPLVDRVDAGGLEFFATHMAALRSENPNTLVVTAGDLIGGSPLLSALFHDEP